MKGLRKRFSTDVRALDETRLQGRFDSFESTPIAEAEARTRVVVAGEVKAIQVVPRAGSPWLEVTVSDGTGKAVAVFSGRRRIAGIEIGRGLVLEGVAGRRAGRVQLMNPVYTLIG